MRSGDKRNITRVDYFLGLHRMTLVGIDLLLQVGDCFSGVRLNLERG